MLLLLPKRSDIISMHIQCIMSAYSCTRDLFIWKFWMTKAKRDEMMRWDVAILSYFTNATHSKLIPSWIWEIKRESTKSETTMNSGAFMINYTRSKKVRIALFCWLHNKTFFFTGDVHHFKCHHPKCVCFTKSWKFMKITSTTWWIIYENFHFHSRNK